MRSATDVLVARPGFFAVSPAANRDGFAKYQIRVRRLVDVAKIKGIVTKEDAQLAVEHGVDGIIVSNHGGKDSRPLFES